MMERPRFLKIWADPKGRPGLGGKTLLGAAVLAGILFVALQGWWVLVPAPAVQAGPQVVEIPAHQSLFGVARTLERAGVIRSPLGFALLSALRGSARGLKAGEYEIPQNATTLLILSLLEEGKVKKHMIRFPEGGTVQDLGRLLEAESLASAEEALGLAGYPSFLRSLGIEAESLEGYLFPDTYHFIKGMTAAEMLARMVQRLREQVTPDILARAEAKGLTLHQLLTLASIIEKEAVAPQERPLISAVFWNRLKREMPLQADPTVQYAVGKERRALTRADLQVPSPFNTYRFPGLPPGPIASPGRAAILAALEPAKAPYLYFVSTGENRHHFSVTLEEHNSAVARYRLARTTK
ncbi:MAG: endolytic transglycosylase MltG [Candidatus Rokubacteria bacterium]|nr:endolytic transglycosylase MltG [Candidatus Rokubacteria bacterium]